MVDWAPETAERSGGGGGGGEGGGADNGYAAISTQLREGKN